MQNVLSRKEVNPGTNVSLAHAHGYLKISRNHLLRVYRDVPARNDAIPESEIALPAEPPTSCDQAIDEHDVISQHSQTSTIAAQVTCFRAFFVERF